MKKKSALTALLLSACLLAGCAAAQTPAAPAAPAAPAQEIKEEAKEEVKEETEEAAEASSANETEILLAAYPLTLTDALGVEVTFEEAPERICTLTPADAEIVCALGGLDKIVGHCSYDTYPAELFDIEIVGDYVGPNTELILGVDADVVFTDDYIDAEMRATLEEAGIKVFVLHANGIDETEANIETVGQIIDASDAAEEIVATMEETRAAAVAMADGKDARRVFVDLGDFYSCGPNSMIDSMLAEIGAVNIAADGDSEWPLLTTEAIIAADPEVYISMFNDAETIKAVAGFDALTCVKNDEIHVVAWDDPRADMIQRCGPRLADGLMALAEMIYGKN